MPANEIRARETRRTMYRLNQDGPRRLFLTIGSDLKLYLLTGRFSLVPVCARARPEDHGNESRQRQDDAKRNMGILLPPRRIADQPADYFHSRVPFLLPVPNR